MPFRFNPCAPCCAGPTTCPHGIETPENGGSTTLTGYFAGLAPVPLTWSPANQWWESGPVAIPPHMSFVSVSPPGSNIILKDVPLNWPGRSDGAGGELPVSCPPIFEHLEVQNDVVGYVPTGAGVNYRFVYTPSCGLHAMTAANYPPATGSSNVNSTGVPGSVFVVGGVNAPQYGYGGPPEYYLGHYSFVVADNAATPPDCLPTFELAMAVPLAETPGVNFVEAPFTPTTDWNLKIGNTTYHSFSGVSGSGNMFVTGFVLNSIDNNLFSTQTFMNVRPINKFVGQEPGPFQFMYLGFYMNSRFFPTIDDGGYSCSGGFLTFDINMVPKIGRLSCFPETSGIYPGQPDYLARLRSV